MAIAETGRSVDLRNLFCVKQENEDCVGRFLAETPDAAEGSIDAEWGIAASHGRQILPGQHQADGFYYAKLKKADVGR